LSGFSDGCPIEGREVWWTRGLVANSIMIWKRFPTAE
jgi:hypothetical protein